MFYAHDLLQRRGGKFGIIWIAATNPKLLSRRDCVAINVNRTCSEILDHILQRMTNESGRRRRLSLYLSSKLMYGVTYVYKKQCLYLFHDTKLFHEHVLVVKPSVRRDENVLPERAPVVTLDDPLRMMPDPEFGRFLVEPYSPPVPLTEFFTVLSPRSSSESETYTPREKARIPPEIEEEPKIQLSPYTVPPSQVTMPELVPAPSFMEEDRLIVPGVKDLPPFEVEDFTEALGKDVIAEVEQPGEVTAIREELEMPIPPEEVATPMVPTTAPEPRRPEKIIPPPPVAEETPVQPPLTTEEEKRRWRIKHMRTEEEGDFELQPVEVTRKRPRRRSVVYDDEIVISQESFKNNIVSANRKLTRPLVIPSLVTSVDLQFRQPGSRIVSSVLKSFWRRLKTVSVPDDPSSPGSYTVIQEAESLREPVEVSPPPISTEDVTDEAQLEVLREKSSQEDSALITSAASFRDMTPSFRVSERETPSRMSPLTLPSVSAEILPSVIPIMETEEPLPELELEEVKPIRKVTREKECIVSPPYTPPPPSPKEPLSPSNQKILSMFSQALRELSPGKSVTFHTLISPLTRNRQYAASALTRLLELHQHRLVNIQQAAPYGTIAILPGTNY